MIQALYFKHTLEFKRPSGTSRGILTTKDSWIIVLKENSKFGIGECSVLKGLSIDDRPDYEKKIQWVCQNIDKGVSYLYENLEEFPSIQFGLEIAYQSLQAEDSFILFPSDFTKNQKSIPINGLVWMGDQEFMKQQIEEKIASGFHCVKLKIGAIDFEKELELLHFIRSHFDEKTIEIRVDANGAFGLDNALSKINQLSQFKLHSIEQPIKQNQVKAMADLCRNTPLPIALDEELIGVIGIENKQNLLQEIRPQYIILKPSLIGGFKGSQEWIDCAESLNIGWWITSALESNIGLNAIAQWTYSLSNKLPQGLGTGGLYTNNFKSPLKVTKGELSYDPQQGWELDCLPIY